MHYLHSCKDKLPIKFRQSIREIALTVRKKKIFLKSNIFMNVWAISGDQFLFTAYRISPFFNEKSSFNTSIEFIGDENVLNITRFEAKTIGVSWQLEIFVNGA